MLGEKKTNSDAWFTVKIRRFFKERIKKQIGSEKEAINQNDFVNQAVKEKLDKLEMSQKP